MVFEKAVREYERLKKRLFRSGKVHKQLEKLRYKADNLPYELYDKFVQGELSITLPIVATAEETLEKILSERCSLSRFGDGEFVLMGDGRIHYQERSEELGGRLKEVIGSNVADLLIGLPPCFGSLDEFLEPVADFWVKCMARKRAVMYSYLDMERLYYDAFFSRIYMHSDKTDRHYARCTAFYRRVKEIWAGREAVVCEGEGTRFGMFNDLLEGAENVERILCPARNAFGRYDEILRAFDDVAKEKLVLVALGPTATVLAYDLCRRGYQAIDIGAMDLDYEWFRRKETRLGAPLEFKYVDSGKGRQVKPLDDPEYSRQIIKRVL